MNKRNRINLGLLVFIAVAAFIVILDSPDKNKRKAPITSLIQQDVNNITVIRPNKAIIYLKKIHNQWRLLKPYNTAINKFRIDTLLRLVETIPQSTYPLIDAYKYGLDKPKLEVKFNSQENNAVNIKFGDSDPIKMRRYISVGEKLYLTNDTYFYALNSIATDYINHKLLPQNFEITQLDLPNLKLAIKDEKWQATPRPKDFSIDSVNELLTEWQNAQAIDIKPFKSKIDILSKKTIKIYGKDASTFVFNIMEDANEFILVNQLAGLKYSFPKEKQLLLLDFPSDSINESDKPAE